MRRLRYAFLGCLLFVLLGCAGVKQALDNYEACKGDPVCVEQMDKAQMSSYSVTKAVTSTAFPSMPEAIAFVISNVVAFGVGVVKGRKKG